MRWPALFPVGLPVPSPAFFWAGLLWLSVLCLSGCSLLKTNDDRNQAETPRLVAGTEPALAAVDGSTTRTDKAGPREAFGIEVRARDDIRDYLVLHLELQRYRQLDDLGAVELSRLMVAAEVNARELLGTLGYFTPTLTLELIDTPPAEGLRSFRKQVAARTVVITVEQGPPSRIGAIAIDFSGPIATDPTSQAQRQSIAGAWSLRAGQTFTQSAWDAAKSNGLRALTLKRYPTGRVQASRADIDADRQSAALGVTYDSGPAFRFGPLQVQGSQRYSVDGARRIAQLPVGSDYDQAKLLEAQQRLASSGYFDSVFLTLDTEGTDPQAAPVTAQVREAPLQKLVLGAGFTTDSGPRLSIDHIHNQMPLLGWRAVSKLSVDSKTRSLGSEWTALPDDSNWRWFGSGLLKRENSGTYDVDSGRVRSGRNQNTGYIDRSYFLQYDYAVNKGDGAPPSASSVSLNWGWTGRYFDNPGEPQRGQGVALESAVGYTLLGQPLPYLRNRVRWLGLVPLGVANAEFGPAARSSRLQLRAEVGAVLAKDAARIPATELFLTGGDTTVRGYGYRELGAVGANSAIVAGRYLAAGGVEWQRPVVYDGHMTKFESVVFVDAGAVADRVNQMKARVGTGVGVRWNSPVGLVQGDLAYGVQARKVRLHVRLGFTF